MNSEEYPAILSKGREGLMLDKSVARDYFTKRVFVVVKMEGKHPHVAAFECTWRSSVRFSFLTFWARA